MPIVFPYAAILKKLDLLHAMLDTDDHCNLIQRCPNLEVLEVDLEAKKETIPTCNHYCDTFYQLPYSTFINLPSENKETVSETSSTISSEVDAVHHEENKEPEFSLLDLYCGCEAMSTGLCLGANLSGFNPVTRWAVDKNEHACESLKLNHPETEDVHWHFQKDGAGSSYS